jgi:hypothetical protein
MKGSSMYRKQLGVGGLVVALVLGVFGALSNSSGQSTPQQALGLTYGGTKALDTVWLRLHPSRAVIAAIEIPFEIAATRCKNDRNGYFSYLYAGFMYRHTIAVGPQGKFSKTLVNRYRDEGIRYEEHQTLTGTITDKRASGTIRARTIATSPNGVVARCSSRTQTWSAVN